MMNVPRTPAKKKAKELAKYLRSERPDYNYLKSVFRHLRSELEVKVSSSSSKKLPDVPTEEEIQRYYEAVWQTRNVQDMVIIKTFLYTGVRVSELVNIRLDDVDFERCQIRINLGKGSKDRIVPFPISFKEVLALHVAQMKQKKATYLFESSWKRKYSDRGIRKMLAKYSEMAVLSQPISPHQLRHFLLTWLKKQGIDDALIQPYSGHSSRQSLEVYSRLSIGDAQEVYNQVIEKFPI
jgi:integrase/recombinase XerD